MRRFVGTAAGTVVKMAEAEIASIPDNLKALKEKIAVACAKRTPEFQDLCENPRLVAVAKTKSVKHVVGAYECGVEHIGENYVQELVDKATGPEMEGCPNIKFHFIGHLQRNKISKLLSAGEKLWMVETVDSETLAKSLNDALARREVATPLNVLVQINTSGEESKSGANPKTAPSLVKFVREECKHLNFKGLMTIGLYENSVTEGPNPDFLALFNTREEVCKELGLDRKDVELSMGMSADYENAILHGSTNIRVGSVIFGARNYTK